MDEFAEAWDALEQRAEIKPTETLGFESLSELLSTLTPNRWELIQQLKRQGPTCIDALAESVGQNSTSVHNDIEALAGFGIV